ncbi:acyl-CoA dehydrogenase family protein [Variovorax sp. 770b2]|uniref:acyl-CoA dehydrogenase family protein n=1 Tax=Variovorax sp. 770b2 TaxID=1566271 RepID=UPI00210BD0A7|nr:acyl-CoA dehydrogenase family protein [Variovorax sp. 770b2]
MPSRSRKTSATSPPSSRRWLTRSLLRQSGLLTLAISCALGGQQARWLGTFRILRRLARADSSLVHLFSFQYAQVASILLFSSEAQQALWLGQAVKHRWFWGNAVNAQDTRLHANRTPDGLEIDGIKGFCSGASNSDGLDVSVSVSLGSPGLASSPRATLRNLIARSSSPIYLVTRSTPCGRPSTT